MKIDARENMRVVLTRAFALVYCGVLLTIATGWYLVAVVAILVLAVGGDLFFYTVRQRPEQ